MIWVYTAQYCRVVSMTALLVKATDSREQVKHKSKLKNKQESAKTMFIFLCSFAFSCCFTTFGGVPKDQTCRCAANSHDSPGQEGQDARSPQVHPKGFYKVGGHPIEVDEVAPVIDKVDHNDGPYCFAG